MALTDLKVSPRPPIGQRRESRAQAWNLTMVLVVLYVINWGDKAVLGLVAQPLAKDLGLSASQIGLVGSIFFLTFTVGNFFAGPLNKWMTLRWVMVLLSLAWAATMLPMVVAASFAVLLLSRLALGLAEGPAAALVHTAVYSWHPPEKRGLPGAFITAGASIAKIAVAPVLAVVVVTWGWRAAFITLAVAGVVWCGLWLATWKDGPYGQRSESGNLGSEPADAAQRTVPWTKIFRTPSFLAGAVATMSMYALVTSVLTWLPSYFEVGLGYSRLQAGAMFGFPSIASLAALMVSSFVTDRLLSRGASARVMRGVVPAVGLLICGVTMATLPLVGVPGVAVLVVSLGYGMGAIIFPLFNAALSQICPPKQLAGTLGVFLALQALGGLVAPFLTGVIVDAAASPAAGYADAFRVFGIAAAVAAVIALLAVNPERDARRVLA
jgi:sugar phosphate permease